MKNQKALSNDSMALNEKNLMVEFNAIEINISTRMNPIHLKFSCTIKDKHSKEEVLIRSTLTNPIIAITNESQWKEAAGKIMNLDAFSGQSTISWSQYVNTLRNHIFQSTSQNPANPNRSFTDSELQYIRERFFQNKIKIGIQDAKNCWEWLGQVLTTIRFKRNVSKLWFAGLIYGLVSKKECTRILRKESNGTFLIRFSESVPGSFAVAYTTDDTSNKVKHYLVKPEDIGANKSLPDFLKEKKLFQKLIQFNANGLPFKLDKEKAFKDYFFQKKGNPNTKYPQPDKSGYVQSLNITSFH